MPESTFNPFKGLLANLLIYTEPFATHNSFYQSTDNVLSIDVHVVLSITLQISSLENVPYKCIDIVLRPSAVVHSEFMH